MILGNVIVVATPSMDKQEFTPNPGVITVANDTDTEVLIEQSCSDIGLDQARIVPPKTVHELQIAGYDTLTYRSPTEPVTGTLRIAEGSMPGHRLVRPSARIAVASSGPTVSPGASETYFLTSDGGMDAEVVTLEGYVSDILGSGGTHQLTVGLQEMDTSAYFHLFTYEKPYDEEIVLDSATMVTADHALIDLLRGLPFTADIQLVVKYSNKSDGPQTFPRQITILYV